MGFFAAFITRPVATILLAIGILLSGAVAYRFLPVSALPSVDIPTIVVIASRPGADPETMANSVAAPLERRLGEISGVTEITSTSTIGNSSIVVQFDLDRDIHGAATAIGRGQVCRDTSHAEPPGCLIGRARCRARTLLQSRSRCSLRRSPAMTNP